MTSALSYTRNGIRTLVELIRCRALPSKIKSIFAWTTKGRSTGFENRRELEVFLRHNWYHNFSPLGIKTNQIQTPGIYVSNQAVKQKTLFKMIDDAIDLCAKSGNEHPFGVELFCADGFYSNYAIQRGAESMLGIDLDADSVEHRGGILEQGALITRLLGNSDKLTLRKADVFDVEGDFDLCICAGGLYHIPNPRDLLAAIRKHTSKALVIQTVVSRENTDVTYFESPAPNWTWGCRFSFAYLVSIVEEAGWTVIRAEENELIENKNLSDRGSAYLLCTAST